MLPDAAKLLRIVAAATDARYLKRRVRTVAVATVAYAVAVMLAALSFVFAFMALYEAMLAVMPPWGAALCVSAVLLLLAVGMVLVAHLVGRSAVPRSYASVQPIEAADVAIASLDPLIERAMEATRQRPGQSLAIAIAVGLVVGRLLGRKRP